MRVLFTCRPAVGHYYPMRPLMDALVAAGDDVALASGHPVTDTAEADGVRTFHAGLDQNNPVVAHHRRTLSGLAPNKIRSYAFTEWFVRSEIPPRLTDLRSVVASFRPDLLVHEVAELAAPIAAASARLPYATHSFGPMLPPEIAAAAGVAAASLWQDLGLDAHPTAGLYEYLYLDICPPSLHVPAFSTLRAVQPVGQCAPSTQEPPQWLRTDQPTVYVTLGTVWNRNVGLFQKILEGLSGEPVNVVVTVGSDIDPAELGVQPPNVTVRRFVPQAQLLPYCSAVVTHGGSGTMIGTLAAASHS